MLSLRYSTCAQKYSYLSRKTDKLCTIIEFIMHFSRLLYNFIFYSSFILMDLVGGRDQKQKTIFNKQNIFRKFIHVNTHILCMLLLIEKLTAYFCFVKMQLHIRAVINNRSMLISNYVLFSLNINVELHSYTLYFISFVCH